MVLQPAAARMTTESRRQWFGIVFRCFPRLKHFGIVPGATVERGPFYRIRIRLVVEIRSVLFTGAAQTKRNPVISLCQWRTWS